MTVIPIILTNIKNAIANLMNNSITAIFNKLAEALGMTIDNTIAELSNTQNIINANIAANNYGKVGYYVNAALAYEDGIDMIIDPVTGNMIYSPVDTSKQTIAQAAFEPDTLTLKVAYVDPATNQLAALPSDMLTRFISYFNEASNGGISIPGIPLNFVSNPPNKFTCNFTITYYGSYSLTNIQNNVVNALTSFQDSFSYNGELFIDILGDYIKQNVPGIKSVNITNMQIDDVDFSGSIKLIAGYFYFDASIITSLNTTAPYVSI